MMIGEKTSDSGGWEMNLQYWLVPISNYKVSELFLCCSLSMIFALNYMLWYSCIVLVFYMKKSFNFSFHILQFYSIHKT